MSDDIYLTRREVARRWRCGLRFIDKLRRDGSLPFVDLRPRDGNKAVVRIRVRDVLLCEDRKLRSVEHIGDLSNLMRVGKAKQRDQE